jgi:hypothetical protein
MPKEHRFFYQYMQYPDKDMTAHRQNKWTWPIQGRLGLKSFQIWKRIIKTTFQCTASGQIPLKLGAWHLERAHESNIWISYYNPTTNDFKPANYRNTYTTCHQDNPSETYFEISCASIPADQYQSGNLTTIRFFNQKQIITNNIQRDFIEDSGQWKQGMIQHINLTHTGQQLYMHPNKPINIVTDGGVYKYQGTYDIVITQGRNILATNGGETI